MDFWIRVNGWSPRFFQGLYHFRQLEEATLAAAQMFEDLEIHVLKDEGPFTLWSLVS